MLFGVMAAGVFFVGCGSRGQRFECVAIDAIFKNPAPYHRRWVGVRGYMSNRLEDVYLTSDKRRIDVKDAVFLNIPVIELVHPRYVRRYSDILSNAEIDALVTREVVGVGMAIGPRYSDDDHSHGCEVSVEGFFLMANSASVGGRREMVLIPMAIKKSAVR